VLCCVIIYHPPKQLSIFFFIAFLWRTRVTSTVDDVFRKFSHTFGTVGSLEMVRNENRTQRIFFGSKNPRLWCWMFHPLQPHPQQACQGLFYYSAWLFDASLSVNRVNEQRTTTVECVGWGLVNERERDDDDDSWGKEKVLKMLMKNFVSFTERQSSIVSFFSALYTLWIITTKHGWIFFQLLFLENIPWQTLKARKRRVELSAGSSNSSKNRKEEKCEREILWAETFLCDDGKFFSVRYFVAKKRK
jgi:hypothetical protein